MACTPTQRGAMMRVTFLRCFLCLGTWRQMSVAADGTPSRTSDQDSRTGRSAQRLEDWARKCGASFSARVKQTPGKGWGLEASKPLQRGDVYAEFPLQCALCVETAEQTSYLKPVFASMRQKMGMGGGRLFGDRPTNLDGKYALTIILLAERIRAKKSFWAPYLASLPTKFTSAPFFDAAERAAIKGTELDSELPKFERFLRDSYDTIKAIAAVHPKALPPEKLTWSLFMWATAVVDSRALPTRGLPSGFPGILLPVVDMENMETEEWSIEYEMKRGEHVPYIYNADRGVVEVRVGMEFQAGSEILTAYYRPNRDLLLTHGFVIKGNPNDEAGLWLDHSYRNLTGRSGSKKNQVGDVWKFRRDVLTQLGYYKENVDKSLEARRYSLGPSWSPGATFDISENPLVKRAGRWVDPQLLLVLRVALMPISELQKRLQNSSESLLELSKPADSATEAAVYARVSALCAARVAEFPTTAEQDEDLLASSVGNMTAKLRLAVLYRLEEKLLLARTIGMQPTVEGSSDVPTHMEL